MRLSKIKTYISSVRAVSAFFITFALCAVLTAVTAVNRSNVEKLTMERLILEKSKNIYETITALIYKTNTLATLVVQSNGVVADFEKTAAAVMDDPAVLCVLAAPNGVVAQVYPPEGNEAVLGLDFFAEGAGNQEAMLAKERGELVIGGPFTLVQGGQALVGRLPVYLTENGEKRFWGLVSIALKYPDVLEGAGLAALEDEGLAYEIWRINPDDGERQIIAQSGYGYPQNARYVERAIPLFNANWYCRISPVRPWYAYSETWLTGAVGLLVSLLVAFSIHSRAELQELSRLDSLTGVYNRRFFMETAPGQIDRAFRNNGEAYIVMFDFDYFKQTNDDYGHPAGDEVLRTITGKIRSLLRSYDLLARYGGEEFVMLFTDMDESAAFSLVERIRNAVAQTPVEYEQFTLSVSASFGIAPVGPDGLDSAIKRADQALYSAKADGRNKAVFYV